SLASARPCCPFDAGIMFGIPLRPPPDAARPGPHSLSRSFGRFALASLWRGKRTCGAQFEDFRFSSNCDMGSQLGTCMMHYAKHTGRASNGLGGPAPSDRDDMTAAKLPLPRAIRD